MNCGPEMFSQHRAPGSDCKTLRPDTGDEIYQFFWTYGLMILSIFHGSSKCYPYLGQEMLMNNIFQEPQNFCVLTYSTIRSVS